MEKSTILKKNINWRIRKVKEVNYLTNFKDFFETNETFCRIWESIDKKNDLEKKEKKISGFYPETNFDEILCDVQEISEEMIKLKVVEVIK